MRGAWRIKKFLSNLKNGAQRIVYSYPKRVKCNICGWSGSHFLSDEWHPHTVCPVCKSQVRHRLLAAAITNLEPFLIDKIIRNKRVLHFAPERSLSTTIRKFAGEYVTADFSGAGVDKILDISKMPQINDGAFDTLIACDILEHVANDRNAMREISRILSSRGIAIITVPQKDNLETAYQDPKFTSVEDRLKFFGQADHLRIYGDDFPHILESEGFEVKVVNEKNFTQEIVLKNVLFPPILSNKPLATNYRKIFFAVKP